MMEMNWLSNSPMAMKYILPIMNPLLSQLGEANREL